MLRACGPDNIYESLVSSEDKRLKPRNPPTDTTLLQEDLLTIIDQYYLIM